MKYLYGASVQGIQGFIFETGKLKEIIGASDFVEHICTTMFQSIVPNFNNDNLIVGAAGNIKYLFDNEDDCKKVVKCFPKKITEKAPSIRISQSVIKLDADKLTGLNLQDLEKRLKIQRNKIFQSFGDGLMISERSRSTGKPGLEWDKNEVDVVLCQDQITKIDYQKDNEHKGLLNKLIGNETIITPRSYPYDLKNLTKDETGWIAIIHADGNGLGKLVMKLHTYANNGISVEELYRTFSQKLDKATIQAARIAFNQIVKDKFVQDKLEFLPIRPVVLGGDDLTVIIRADLAFDFTESFLLNFEDQTKIEFKGFSDEHGIIELQNGLTSCAGISFIKSNYPFYYGYNLAEDLCAYAKKLSKREASCLMFHKIQSSFVSDYEDIIKHELKADEINFAYGPYFLNKKETYATTEQIKKWIKYINLDDSPKSNLRNWLSELFTEPEMAKQTMERIKSISSPYFVQNLNLQNPFVERYTEKTENEFRENIFTPIFDILSLSSIVNE